MYADVRFQRLRIDSLKRTYKSLAVVRLRQNRTIILSPLSSSFAQTNCSYLTLKIT